MDVDWIFVRSYFLSLVLHSLIIVLLVFSVDTPVKRVASPLPKVNIVKAVAVDSKLVEKEFKRLKEIENEKFAKEKEKQQALENKLKELEKKTTAAEKSRKNEEKKLSELKKKQAAEQEKKKAAEQKKKEIEKKQQDETEKKRKEEIDRKESEALKLKNEEELKRKREEEKRLQDELVEEQLQQELAQKNRDQQLLQNIYRDIYRRVVGNFNKSGLSDGMECVLSVQLVPGGEVVSVTIKKSSGDDIFDRRALVAVQKASPLPQIPGDIATFERLNLRKLSFRFKP